MKCIVSTMTNTVAYAFFENVGGVPTIKQRIRICGGAGLPSFKSNGFGDMSQDAEGKPMWTPQGVVTPVSEEAYAILAKHPLFQRHLKGGKVKVVNQNIQGDHKAAKEVVRDMIPRDGFAQLTPQTYSGRVKVSTAAERDKQQSHIL